MPAISFKRARQCASSTVAVTMACWAISWSNWLLFNRAGFLSIPRLECVNVPVINWK